MPELFSGMPLQLVTNIVQLCPPFLPRRLITNLCQAHIKAWVTIKVLALELVAFHILTGMNRAALGRLELFLFIPWSDAEHALLLAI